MIKRSEYPVESFEALERVLVKRKVAPGIFYMDVVEGRDESFEPIMEGTERLAGRYEMAPHEGDGREHIVFRTDSMPPDYTLAISEEMVARGSVAILARHRPQ